MIDQLEDVESNLAHFVDDNRNPCILVTMSGEIIHANTLFKNKFSLRQGANFLSLLKTRQGISSWEEFRETATETKVAFLENLIVHIASNLECLCKAHIFYCNDSKKAVITFILPAIYSELPESAYSGCFTKISKTIMILDENGYIVDVNDRVQEIFQLSKNSLIGKHIQTVYRKYNTKKSNAEKQYANHLQHLMTHGEVVFTERFESGPNDIKFLQVNAAYTPENNLYLVELKDCTETELLRRQLDHSGSLSTVGQMAASIAHEIRNPMTTLKGFVQLMEVTATGDTAKYLSVVDSELHRMEEILNEMLMLSKPSDEKYSEFSLGVLVTKVLEIMKPKAMFEKIEINWQDSSFSNSMIYSNANKVKQVLMNLFKNSFEAMETGGTLALKLEKDYNDSFKLTITDTGKGMSPLQIKSIFMPFFTSKPEGTGLGLPFVLKTVEELGGKVAVTSVPDEGTTFVLQFPKNCVNPLMSSDQLSAN